MTNTIRMTNIALTDEQRDLARDVLQAKREHINRAAEALLYEVEALDQLLVLLDVALCPNCGAPANHHDEGECSLEPCGA